jgi:MYXO-CTERM domain-containing protein
MNGVLLSNDFQTLSAVVAGTGSTLTLQLNAQGDSEEPYVFDNIQVCGTLVPTPGATALLGLAGLAGLRRRR